MNVSGRQTGKFAPQEFKRVRILHGAVSPVAREKRKDCW